MPYFVKNNCSLLILRFNIFRASDDLGINEKMIYSSSKEALKVKIDPSVMVQANDEDELSIEHVLSM